MATPLGIVLLIVGLGWACLGLWNFVLMDWTRGPDGSVVAALGIIGNMLLYVLPGLVVAGLGALLAKSWITRITTPIPVVFPDAPASARRPPSSKTCSFCAETIKFEAAVCRYCGRDLPASEAAQAAG
jgi:hypothetical protein